MNKSNHKMNSADAYTSETNQKDLASGILKQAVQDLRRFHGATRRVERELYLDAYRWVVSDDGTWPFSFLNVCQLLNLTPDNLRPELLADASAGIFAYWSRRSARAARSFQVFLNRALAEKRSKVVVDPVPLTVHASQ